MRGLKSSTSRARRSSIPAIKGKGARRRTDKRPRWNRHGKGGQIDPEIMVKRGGRTLGKGSDEIPAHITDQNLRGPYQNAGQ